MLHALLGIFSKLRNLNALSETFDERQFFVNEDEFEQTNPSQGDRCCYLFKRENIRNEWLFLIDILFLFD